MELFAQDGREVFTALIYPDPASTGLALYAKGGEAVFESLRVYGQESLYNNRVFEME